MSRDGEVGGEAPVDLGAAAFQPIARIRAAAAALGLPWWTIAPFGVTDLARTSRGRTLRDRSQGPDVTNASRSGSMPLPPLAIAAIRPA